jgi:hypothetical protein
MVQLFNVHHVFMLYLLCGNSVSDVSKESEASIFRVEVSGKQSVLFHMIQAFSTS